MSASDLHEVNQYPDAAFPVALFCGSHHGVVPHGRGLMDYHWHPELQITIITSGSAVLQIGAAHYSLSAGEALYIGSGLVHAVTELSQDGTYASLNFPAKLLGFFPGSRMEQQDVLPFTSGTRMSSPRQKNMDLFLRHSGQQNCCPGRPSGAYSLCLLFRRSYSKEILRYIFDFDPVSRKEVNSLNEPINQGLCQGVRIA